MEDFHAISLFAGKEQNAAGPYERFKHTKVYIRQKSLAPALGYKQDPTLKPKLKTIMAETGYADFSVFLRRREKWLALAGPVPLAWFAAIGLDLKTLDLTLKLDMREFESAMAIPRYPRCAILRVHPCVYPRKQFPEGTTEAEAVELLKEFVKETPVPCVIHYPGLKTIIVSRTGDVWDYLYPPVMTINDTHAVPLHEPGGVGTVRV